MQYRNTIRVAVSATAVIAAALSLSACQSGGGDPAAGTSSPAPTTAAPSPTASSSASSTSPGTGGSRPSGTASTAGSAPASPASATSTGSAPACAASAVEAGARQAAERPDGTGVGAAVVEFTNVSGRTCVLSGFPTVAGAGNGSPGHNAPLTVTRKGAASAVRVAPGGKAWVKLTFVQVQGEGDGYCVSGAKPVAYPTLVVGLPGAGSHQVALSDGLFAECDNKVTATAVSAVKPA